MKRITSLILSLAIMLNTAAGISFPVAAESESKEYIHDGYTVTYKVVSEWTGNQNVSVTIENTGEEEICGWALKYETPGTIGSIWNGKIYSENEDTHIISAQSYNNIIYAGNKVTFGYIVSGENLEFPEEMILCNEWREADESVEFSYEIVGDWGSTYQAQVFISNNTEKEIDCWKLGFYFTGEISQIWNCVLLNQNEGSAFVRNSGSSSTIAPDSEVSFSFIGKKNEGEIPELSDFFMYENCINEEKNMADLPLQLMGYADFTDDVLTINWYSTVEEGKFQVLKSSDNEAFEVIAELEDVLSYEYGAVDFEKAYFKITQLDPDSRYTESAVIAVEYENGECNWEYLDTDEDGIPDVYEESIGTDITKPDTDDDGLTDYEELYLTNTDPLVYNSVNEELSDADADCDEDGVSNKTEIENGTNPLLPDTDYDSIDDGKEAELGTDPVNSDTDGDGIGDGDELVLNLDPTSDTTDGIKDNERTTVQEITADSEIMSEINTEENPMKVSIEFEAAGLAESSLDVSESGYSSAMSNSAIVGGIPEFSYPAGLSTGEVTVKFEVDDSVKANTVGDYAENCEELQGIKRFNVFKYFEDTNMLLPIETFHDEEQGIVYTKTDCLGTYCVMDLEIWMQNLGVEPETEELTEATESIEYLSTETVDVSYLSASEDSSTINSSEEGFNVVFYLDTRKSVDSAEFEEMKNVLKDTLEILVDNTITSENSGALLNIKEPIVCTHDFGDNYTYRTITFDSDIEAISDIKQAEQKNSMDDAFDLTDTLNSIFKRYSGKSTILFVVTSNKKILARSDESKKIYQHLEHSENVHVAFISRDIDPAKYSYVEAMVKVSKGEVISDFNVNEIMNYVYSFMKSNEYKIITANNYETVTLKSVLRKNSKTDTDLDNLEDWGEINIELIEQFNPDSTVKGYLIMDDMPTIEQLKKHQIEVLKNSLNKESETEKESEEKKDSYFYIESGLNRYMSENGSNPYSALFVPVVPIKSVPVDADGDNDGLPDSCDKMKLKKSNIYSNSENKSINFMVLAKYTGLNNMGVKIKVKEYVPVYSLPSKSVILMESSEFNLRYVVKNNYGELYGKIQLESGLCGYIMLSDIDFEYEDQTVITKTINENESAKEYKINNNIYISEKKDDSYVVSQFYDENYEFSLYLTSLDIEQDNNYYNSLTVEKNKIKYNGYGKAINVYKTLSDTSSIWYKSGFNISSYGECPWYAFGRIGEVYGCYLKFDGSANGGFWIENTLGIAYEYDTESKEIKKDKVTNLVIEKNPYNVKKNSVVSFLYGKFGHVMFIEAVQRDEVTGKPLNVIFSDSWNEYDSEGLMIGNRSSIGALIEMSFDDFILLYSSNATNEKNTNNFSLNPNFSGYIQFG